MPLVTVDTFMLDGTGASLVRAEVNAERGPPPAYRLDGLPDPAAKETQERVRAALVNSGFDFRRGERIWVDLWPSGPYKPRSLAFDLPISVALLVASGQLDWEWPSRMAMVGELALDGSLRPISDAVAIAEAARSNKSKGIVLPAENSAEAALVDGIEVVALENLRQLLTLGRVGPIPPSALDHT